MKEQGRAIGNWTKYIREHPLQATSLLAVLFLSSCRAEIANIAGESEATGFPFADPSQAVEGNNIDLINFVEYDKLGISIGVTVASLLGTMALIRRQQKVNRRRRKQG